MKIVKEKITLEELKDMSEKMFNNLVKAVVDIEQEIMVVDADLHADAEYLLIENGSQPTKLWGITFHSGEANLDNWVQFNSLINVRPRCNNKSLYIEDQKIREQIIKIVNTLVKK